MKRRNRFRIIILAAVIALLVLIVALFFIVRTVTSGLDSLTLSPDFTEQELDINTDYTFTITADPEKASLKSLEYVIDNTAATFSASDAADGQAVLHTVSEGTVTVCVKKSDVESNYLTFNIVDQAAKAAAEAQAEAEAQAAAEAEAQAAAEAEAAANATELVIATDNVRIRATPTTDGEVLATCKKGDSFTRTEQTEDGWSKIDYNGTEAYMKSEYLQVTTEEEIQQAKEQAEKEAEEKKKTAEETAAASESTSTPADTAAADAQAQADAAATAAQTAALEAAQAQAAAAAAAQAAAGVPFTDKNGVTTVFTRTEWNYFLSYWDYTGQAEEMISHHTGDELRTLYNNTH